MNRMLLPAVMIAITFLMVPVGETLAESCSCTAPDNSCSASVSCPGRGCFSSCMSGGSCWAQCAGSGPPRELSSPPPDEEGALHSLALPGGAQERLVSLRAVAATSADVSAVLSEQLGFEVVFVPAKPDALISMDVVEFPVSELIQILASRGAISLSGRQVDFQRPSGDIGDDRPVSIHAQEVDAAAISRLLSDLLDREVVLRPADPEALFNLDIKGIRGAELLWYFSRFGTLAVDGSEFED